jgi:hypothetical protein
MAMQTSWFSNERTAASEAPARRGFAVHSLPVVRRCLRARGHGTLLLREPQDAVPELFADRPSEHGAPGRAQDGSAGFRGFQHVALRRLPRGREGAPAVPTSAEVRSVAGTGGVR